MHIIAIAWLWVALMMAITERSLTAGVLTFVFYGLAPCALLLWLFGFGKPKRVRAASVPDENVHHPDRADAQPNQRKLGD